MNSTEIQTTGVRGFRGQQLIVSSFLSILIMGPILCEAGAYKPSKVFPTGIHANLHVMTQEDRELAVAFQRALSHLGDLPGPLVCETPLDREAVEVTRPDWTILDGLSNFEVLKLAYRLYSQQYGHQITWIDSPTGESNLRKALTEGHTQLSTTSVPIFPKQGVTQILRVRFSDCRAEQMERGRVSFFIVNDSDLLKLRIVKGLGEPTDIFLYRGQAYFDSHSYRDFDDSFQKRLPKKQSEIYIHSMYDQTYHVPRARLLYWDEELTRTFAKPGKKGRSPVP